MKHIFSLIYSTMLFTAMAPAETNAPITLPAKEKLKLYLLMGQSNMAGRGVPEKEDLTPHPRVLMFNQSNRWEVAVEPITRGEKKKTPGVGPGLAFAKVMAEKNPEVVIGLVPCAVGGTPLRRWEHGADLYTNAVARAQAAMKVGTLAGILWHQGESDAGKEENAKTYQERLSKMITALRADLHAPNLPFVVGQIGEFNYDRPGNPLPYARLVNESLMSLPQHVPFTACASAHGLSDKGDQLHFNAQSQREFGRRYATEMMKLEAVH